MSLNLHAPIAPRLQQQLAFLLEIDRLKSVLRQSRLIGVDRRENSAEHSWHLAMLALILAEYSDEPIDLMRVISLVLIHDIVEIDAGDTYCYDTAALSSKADREAQAAARIFGLLPDDQATALMDGWQEFEASVTPEARFAQVLDRLMPLLHNSMSQGIVWQEHGITAAQVHARNQSIAAASRSLAELVDAVLADAVRLGYLPRDAGAHRAGEANP